MVMTLCLLVYAALEYKIRTKLHETVYVNNKKTQVTNLKQRHHIILRCLGPPYQKLYYSELWG